MNSISHRTKIYPIQLLEHDIGYSHSQRICNDWKNRFKPVCLAINWIVMKCATSKVSLFHSLCLPLSRRVESSNIKFITIQIELIVYTLHSNVGGLSEIEIWLSVFYRYSLQLYITMCRAASSPIHHRNIIKKPISICAQPQAGLKQHRQSCRLYEKLIETKLNEKKFFEIVKQNQLVILQFLFVFVFVCNFIR